MSKYTTQVRFICESKAGLDNSVGSDDVEHIIELARPKIFDFDYPIFDESYRKVLETKILKHYYLREIGQETYGVWKLFLNRKMNEIMPYFNQLYKSELLEFNPLYTVDLNRTRQVKDEGTSKTVETGQASSTGTVSNTGSATDTVINEHVDRYSDTPQGGLNGLREDKYMSNARIVNDNGSNSNQHSDTTQSSDSSNSSGETNGEVKNTQDYLEHVAGYDGKVASEMLMKYRETFLNIDVQVIDELSDLFMLLW